MTPAEYIGVSDKRISIAFIGLLNGLTLSDPSKNNYNPVGVNIIKDKNITADKKEFLDVLAPSASTTAVQSGGKYTPVFYSGGDNSEFYFPVIPSDNKMTDPAYVSGLNTNENSGYFEWTSALDFSFVYKVSASALKPSDPVETWQTGSTNTKYGFTQIEAGSFIHIALLDTVNYNISNTAIKVYSSDFAGNMAAIDFGLDYLYDTTGPVVTPVSYKTGINTTDGTGYINAVIRLEDLSMVDIAKVYSRWYDNTTKTYLSDWVQYSGTVSESAVSMELEFSMNGLTRGNNHDYNLMIMANDHSAVVAGGNQTVTDLSDSRLHYTLDLTYPAYDFSYSTGYEAEPSLKISNLQTHPDTYEDSTVIVMIKDPFASDKYFVRTITTGSYKGYFLNNMPDGDVLNHFTYRPLEYQPGEISGSGQALSEPTLWRYHTVSTDSTSGDAILYRFNDDAPNLRLLMGSTQPEDRLTARRLQAIMGGKYYGDIEITVIAGYGAVGRSTGVDVTAGAAYDTIIAAYPGATNVKSYASDSGNFRGLDCYCATKTDKSLAFAALDKDGAILNTNTIVENSYTINSFTPWLFCSYISSIPKTAVVDVKTYTLKAASKEYAVSGAGYQDTDVYNWNVTHKNVHTIDLVRTSGDSTLPWGGIKVPTNLDDEELTFTVKNAVIESWGLADVDFNSNDTYIGLFLLSSPEAGAPVSSSTPLWKTRLAELASQSFSIPADVTQYSGHYLVRVQISSKGSGNWENLGTFDSDYVNYTVDRTALTDFGPKSSSHSMNYMTPSGSVTVSELFNYSLATPRIYMGSQSGKDVKLAFGASGGPITDGAATYRNQFIRVWNASSGINENIARDSATWFDISAGEYSKNYQISFFDSAAVVESTVLGDAANAGLGLIRGMENMIHYQIAGVNGELSAVRTLVIEVSDELPTIEMGMTPDSSVKNIKSANIFVKELDSATLTELTAKTVEAVPQTVGSAGYTITDNNAHVFYTVNVYGNFAFDEVTAPFVDSTNPSTSLFSFTGDMNGKNNLGIIFDDNMPADPSETKLYLKFEQAYMDRLKSISSFEVNPDGYMQVTLPSIPSGQDGAEWTCGSNTAPGGIYKIYVYKNMGTGNFGVWIYMDYLYDSTKPGEFDMKASFYMEDEAGNRSTLNEGTILVLNQAPAIKSAVNNYSLYNNLMDADFIFNKPVRTITPDYTTHTNHSPWPILLHEDPENGYSFTREAVPMFGMGEYEVTVMDVFGVEYTNTYTPAPDFFGKFGLDVQYSTSALTKEDVTVTITAQTTGTTFQVADVPENSVLSVPKDAYVASASVKLSENGYIYLDLNNSGTRWVSIPVTNILNHAPGADETWYYSEFSSNTLPAGVAQTTHKVTVFISSAISNRRIEGAEGSSLSYTFPFGTQKGAAYTFTYTDEVGNIGTKTVYCPVSIVRPALPAEDKEAPNFTVKVFGKYGDVYKQRESWYSPKTVTPLDADGNALPSVTTDVINTGVAPDGSTIAYANFRELLANMSWTGGY
jgi:hypothetical protein